MSIAIRVVGLGKQYRIGKLADRPTSLRETLGGVLSAPARNLARLRRLAGSRTGGVDHDADTIWALRDVSFDVPQGQVLGIIGRNGAGKSTLLKVLSRITEPTRGFAEVHGHMGSLLEVGTGFHPELTGRENIFLNGAILGMDRAHIRRNLEEIVEFSGVRRFIDTPVKRYSSGMYLRLAFAVAAHLDPDVLLVDEVLAVGDAEFQKKCTGRMTAVAGEGRTVVFVSHNLVMMEQLCQRAIFLKDGVVVHDGSVNTAIADYLRVTGAVPFGAPIDGPRSGSGDIRLMEFALLDKDDERVWTTQSGRDTVFGLRYESNGDLGSRSVDVGFSVKTMLGQTVFILYTSYTASEFRSVPEQGWFRLTIPRLPLPPGRYEIGGRVVVGGIEADWPRKPAGFIDVEPGDFYRTGSAGADGSVSILMDGIWNVA